MGQLVVQVYEGVREYDLSIGLTPVLVVSPLGLSGRSSLWLTNLSGVTLYGGFNSGISSSDYSFLVPSGGDPVQLVGVSHKVPVYVVAGSAGPYSLGVVEFF